MPKIRIYELARQHDVSVKEVMDLLSGYGRQVNNQLSAVEDGDVTRVTRDLSAKRGTPRPAEPQPDQGQRPAQPEPPPRPAAPAAAADPVRADEKARTAAEETPRARKPHPEGAPPLGSDGKTPARKPRPEGAVPLGPDGRPLPLKPRSEGAPPLGSDGKPLMRRRRADGALPLGPDGRPLMRRPRAEGAPPLGPDGRPLMRRSRPDGAPPLGPDGRPLMRRPRAEGAPAPGSDGRAAVRRPRPEEASSEGSEGRQPTRPRRMEDVPSPGRNKVPTAAKPPEGAAETAGKTPAPVPVTLAPPVQPAAVSAAPPAAIAPASPETAPAPKPASPSAASAPAVEAAAAFPASPRLAPEPQPAARPAAAPSGDRSRPAAPGGARPGNRPASGQTRPGGGQGSGQRSGGAPRGDGQRSGGTGPSGAPRPSFSGTSGGARSAGGGSGGFRSGGARPSGSFSGGARPSGSFSGGTRSGGPGRPGGFVKKDGPGGPARPGAGRPGAGRPGASGSVAGAKPKVAEPTKDDRSKDWKKDAEMRSVKSKDNRTPDKNENKKILDRKDGHGRRGAGKPKEARAAAKRVMPVKVEPVITEITFPPEGTVRDLAEKLRKSNADIIKVLMKRGQMVTASHVLTFDEAGEIAETFGVLVNEYMEVDVFEQAFAATPDDEAALCDRPPVVVVMGHVDHGKTSLLDVIRNANVTSTEAGGITQHIGAYTVEINGKPITFLDTPGHEAFTAMRMRGAQVTDIAVLVVAADDGVMPQTIEAINHAKAAGVDIIVAINKIDKPSANPDRVKQELTEYGILVEDWGGETIAVPMSALQKTGIEQLLEMIILVSEMKELKANPSKPARGSIVEAKLDKGRGPVATVLVQDGTLRVGDPVVAGACFGKIRAMTDDKGKSVREAGPSIPVEIIGLSDVPVAGDTFYAAEHEKQARQLSETVVAKGRESLIKSTPAKVSLDDLFNQIQAGNMQDLNIIIKADVQGSVEALRTSLDKLSNDEVRVRVIHGGVGAINESDVMLASASSAIIIGFNVRPETKAKQVADAEKVDLRLYRVIYSAIDDIAAALKGMLAPEFIEKALGSAEIRQIFRASGVGAIAGCYVLEGHIQRSAKVRVVRDGRVVYDGTLGTLRRFKDDVREVAAGYECGMVFTRFNDIKENDRVEAYVMEEVPR